MQVRLNTGMKTFAQRVKERREELGLTQGQVAKLAGLKQPDVSKIERGGIQKTTEILGLAKALQCNPDWLANEVGGMLPTTRSGKLSLPINLDGNSEFPGVRRVRIKAQAGATGFAVEDLPEDGPPIVFRADWYEAKGYRPEKMLALRISGDSMIPNLYEGDVVVVNTDQTTPREGIAFLANHEGEIVVKRLARDMGQWWLTSDNPDQKRYQRKACHEGTQIIGEVVYRQTERV